MTLLAIDGIAKSFGVVKVLDGVGLEVETGHVLALLGENGAGKSTLMKILLGIEQANAGTMKLGGELYAPRSPAGARAAGVAMVPQERTLCPDLTVAENIVLGLEPTRGGFVQRDAARATAEKALGLVTGPQRRIPLDVRAKHLGVADQQLVEIARALAQPGTRVLVLDEPTASLGHDDAARLFTRVQALKSTGMAVILVTHFLADVRAHADRYTVLRDGKVAGSGDPKTTPAEQIVKEMLGQELAREEGSERATRTVGATVLDVKSLAGKERPRKVSFELHRGEIFGIAGLVGSGRTETLRLIAGLDRVEAGTIELKTEKGVGLLSEDRGGEGLMLRRSIAENVTLSKRSPLFAWPSAAVVEGAKWIKELAVKARDASQNVGELSGGNQQKVQVARLLREDYDVLLVDEPTRGIDVAAKAQLLGLLKKLADEGKAIVLVSSQLDELVSTCDRIAVLRRGQLEEPKPANEWTEEKLLLEASS